VYWAAAPSTGTRTAIIVGAVGATIFGTITESLQLLQPTRSVEIRDLLANTIGVLLVCSLIVGIRGILTRRST
jgi:VanZ family protein